MIVLAHSSLYRHLKQLDSGTMERQDKVYVYRQLESSHLLSWNFVGIVGLLAWTFARHAQSVEVDVSVAIAVATSADWMWRRVRRTKARASGYGDKRGNELPFTERLRNGSKEM